MEFTLIDRGLSPLINRYIPQDVINTLYESIKIDGLYNNNSFRVVNKEISEDNTIKINIEFIEKEEHETLLDNPNNFKMCYKVKSVKQPVDIEAVDKTVFEKPIVLIEDLFFLPKHISF